jgi:hypothetical protein
MKKLYNKLSQLELKYVKKCLSGIDYLLLHEEERKSYFSLAVSTFDHWLTRDEAEVLFDISEEEQIKRNTGHFKFCELLYKETTVYDIKCKKRRKKNHHHFRKFSNYSSFKKRVDNDSYFQGHNFYMLALPDYEAIYHQHYDDTQILYFRNPEKIKPFRELVKQTNLHILEMENH